MNAATPAKFENIVFHFVTAADDHRPIDLRGIVLSRQREMVLEIKRPDNPRPYVVVGRAMVGKANHSYFAGNHRGLPGDDAVTAKWTALDEGYIGTWFEDGIEWLFTFQLLER